MNRTEILAAFDKIGGLLDDAHEQYIPILEDVEATVGDEAFRFLAKLDKLRHDTGMIGNQMRRGTSGEN